MSNYLKLFNTHAEYTAFTQTDEFVKPNVSHCIQENEVHYNPYDYSDRYLTFIALENGSEFSFNPMSSNTISYSVDDGETWTTLASGASTPSIDNGEKIMWKGEMTSYMDVEQQLVGVGTFTSTKTFDVEGNAMSLLYGDDFEGENSLEGKDGGFSQLFAQTKVVNAKNLYLPTTLAGACYYGMFGECQNLITTPKLSATELTSYINEPYSIYIGCYTYMFYRCTSLITAPELPATTLAVQCYNGMFRGCTSLTTAPKLPATVLANACYDSMFNDCSSLTTPPELPATTLADSCYRCMFDGCTSLTTAPELPVTTLANDCYSNMFQDCSSLTTAPELPATTLANNCYFYMFGGCNNLTSVPELPATTLAEGCYKEMFHCCISLTTAPELPATIMARECYSGMFSGCESLLTAPSLPSTTLAERCYGNMFGGAISYHIYDGNTVYCTSLTTAPELPAITLVSNCYQSMFNGCTSLNYIKAMFTTTPSATYTSNWVNGVATSGTFVKNSAAQWDVTGNNGIPTNWTVETASE